MEELTKKELSSYSYDDFVDTIAPYEYVYQFKEKPFTHNLEIERMSKIGKKVGFSNFKSSYKNYCKEIQGNSKGITSISVTNFEGQPFELSCGSWEANENGVYKQTESLGTVEACPHPIMPIRRLINVETNEEKIELIYKKGGKWRKTIADKRVLASSQSILTLSSQGIAVTSENSKWLVKYLHDMENLNYDRLTENLCVSKLGWLQNKTFLPYADDVVFDGHASCKRLFDSIQPNGDKNVWLEVVKEIRASDKIEPKILLAASFASPLLQICGALPFFVHMYGGTGVGKTVAEMLAASVWGNPELGYYIQTFNSTDVGQEILAGFLNSLPLVLDELQIVKDRKNFDNTIYKLTEGVGRTRGAKTGGLQNQLTWKNVIISSGEQPILSDQSGGGAVNRILQLDCDGDKFFPDPQKLSRLLKTNYGHIGKEFVQLIVDGTISKTEIIEKQGKAYKQFLENATEKQAIAGSLIKVSDELIDKYIFKDGKQLSFDDLAKHLADANEVSQEERSYELLRGWLSVNQNKFVVENITPANEIWGEILIMEIRIINFIFKQFCEQHNISDKIFTKWLQKQNKIITSEKDRSPYKTVRLLGASQRCLVLKMDFDEMEIVDDEEIPF